MAIQHLPSTNGHGSAQGAPIAATDDVAQPSSAARSRFGVRPGRLLVPAVLALGVILLLRHFEQSTSG